MPPAENRQTTVPTPLAKFQYELTEHDREALLRWILGRDPDFLRQRRRGFLTLFLFAAWFGSGVAVGAWQAMVRHQWHWPIWVAADAALLFALLFVARRWTLRSLASRSCARERRWEEQGLVARDYSVRIVVTEDGFQVSQGEHVAVYRWRLMKYVESAPDGIYFGFGAQVVRVPARLFTSMEEMARFADVAKKHAARRGL
jgi:hypothetical protein